MNYFTHSWAYPLVLTILLTTWLWYCVKSEPHFLDKFMGIIALLVGALGTVVIWSVWVLVGVIVRMFQ